ncbi:MAG TPA: hypothetical protein VGX76_12695 [Pirellulales bacterium]|nr:hypothetical protein [Pirellulales bacterium]
MPKPLRAGAATSNITPSLGCSLNGGMSDRFATQIHDELHARCLVLDDGDVLLGLVVCDSCAIPTEVIDAAKLAAHGRSSLLPDHVLVSATHTHSAPTAVSTFQSDPDPEYQAFLSLRIADGLRRALANLSPARIGWGVGREPTQVFNRRWKLKPGKVPANPFGAVDQVQMNPPVGSPDLVEPAGPIDPEISLLAVQSTDGRPLAVLANYSLHYVGGTGPTDVSADYFAIFADRLQQLLAADRLDPPFVGMMSNGTSGNINNIDFLHPRDGAPPYQQMRHVAHVVADEALRVYRAIEFRDSVELGIRESRIALRRRLPAADEVERAKFILAQGKGAELRSLEEIYARETVLLSDWPATIETVVQGLRVGELGIAALPCEVFVETGLAIKESSPFKPTFTISLANGYAGYLPTREHHQLGGYETWRARSSFLEVDAEPQLRRQAIELLGELF